MANLQPREQRTRKRYRILLSSFSQNEKAHLAKIIERFGGIYLETPNFVASCTHIICEKPNRGEKFLCGCASGKWVLKKDFLLDSLKKETWVEESSYEWDSNKGCEHIPLPHILAPRRWRKTLSSNSSCDMRPFAQCTAVIVISDANKRQAYKRLLESGGGTILSLKPPFDITSLAGKLTHVFTEKNLEAAITGLRKAGLPCLSPDFIPESILRDPKPQASEFDINSYNPRTAGSVINKPSLVQSTCSLNQRTRAGRNKNSVKENYSNQSILSTSKPNSHHLNTVKRKINVSSNLSSESKKAKKGVDSVISDWLNVSTHHNTYQKNKSSVTLSSKKSARRTTQFSSNIQHTVSNTLEENLFNKTLATIHSFLSTNRFPPALTVHIVMRDILMNSTCTALSNRAYCLLQHLLYLHPPSVNRNLYQTALRSPLLDNVADTQMMGSMWEFVRWPIRLLLGLDGTMNQEQTVERGKGDNLEGSFLLLKFLVLLMERDLSAYIGPNREASSNNSPLVWTMFWPSGSGVGVNCEVRELIKLSWASIRIAQTDGKKVEVVHLLQSLVAMAAQCCRNADKSNGLVIGDRAESIAVEIAMKYSTNDTDSSCLKLLLETCRPMWLRLRVSELILQNHCDDCLVPRENRFLLSSPVSLAKIVGCYFFLLPKMVNEGKRKNSFDVTTTGTVRNRKRRGQPLQVIGDLNHPDCLLNHEDETKTKKAGINRRNIRGETKLHTACIKNESTLVRQLLRDGADANITDYAGWTPLHEACNHGNTQCVQEILAARRVVLGSDKVTGLSGDKLVDLLAAPQDGTTPLHDAASNGHVAVAKLLLAIGGVRLLEVEQANGCRPVDIAGSKEMRQYLSDQTNCLQTQICNAKNSTSSTAIIKFSSDKLNLARPTEEMYKNVLPKKGRRKHGEVCVQQCEELLLVLSHLLQVYVHLRQLSADCRGGDCAENNIRDDDLSYWKDFKSHAENLTLHIARIIQGRDLSPLCCVRLAAMCAMH